MRMQQAVLLLVIYKRDAGDAASVIIAFPAAPDASAMTVSFVDVSPSTVICAHTLMHHLRHHLQIRAACKNVPCMLGANSTVSSKPTH
jgi:hypothetical protein